MHISEVQLIVASVPDREDVVIELWAGNELLAEMRKEAGDILIELYVRRDGARWSLAMASLKSALIEAEKKFSE